WTRFSGLDLEAVAQLFERGLVPAETSMAGGRHQKAQTWLAALAEPGSLLGRFLSFRSESIARLVADAHAEASRLGRKVSLDLFSPGLAPLVGQDYGALTRYAAWAKPMTYRAALGRQDCASKSRRSSKVPHACSV